MKRKCIAIVLVCLSVCACKETILHDLDEDQANQVKIALSQGGIEAEKQREGASWNLAVPAPQVNRALRAIETTRILNRSSSRKAPERSNSLLQTAEDRARIHEQDLSVHLEKTLERFPGVLEARVHLNLSLPRALSLLDDAEGNSASVLLVTRAEARVPQKDIQRIVAGASGILVEEISVVVVASGSDEAKEALPVSALQIEKVVADKETVAVAEREVGAGSATERLLPDLSGLLGKAPFLLGAAVLLTVLLFYKRSARGKSDSVEEESDLLRPPAVSDSLTSVFTSPAMTDGASSPPVNEFANEPVKKNMRKNEVSL